MKTHMLSLLAGMALLTSVGVAQAAEPIALTGSQMDQVTGGDVPGLAPNPGSQNASNSDNLVGLYSAQVIHNGPVVSEQATSGDRATLVQGYLGH